MEGVRQTIGTMFTVLLSASLLIAGICFFLRHPILVLLNTPAESYAYTLDYTVTCIAGLPFIYGSNAVSAILRGMGDSKRPFVFIAIAAVLNMILDVSFVVGSGKEAFGAALATAIGQGTATLCRWPISTSGGSLLDLTSKKRVCSLARHTETAVGSGYPDGDPIGGGQLFQNRADIVDQPIRCGILRSGKRVQ